MATSAGREALSRSRSGSPPASINVAGPDENKAAIQHIQIAIQMGEEVVQQMRQQGLDGEVDELRSMIDLLNKPLRAGPLSQDGLEDVIEEAQALIAKLLTFGAR